MAKRSLAATLVAVFSVAPWFAPANAGAVESLRPIRTLVYDVAVTIGNTRRSERTGTGAAGAPPETGARHRPSGGSGSARPAGSRDASSASVDAQGSIRADVMAVTQDAGLVVDLTETASGRNRAKVRLAITADGNVTYDPRFATEVSGEELALARWLARGFYGERPTDPGTAWTVDQSGNGVNAAEHYRVVATDSPRVTLNYTREEEKSIGADAYGETRQGSVLYDRFMVAPIRATYQGQARRDFIGAFDTTLTSVTLTLRTDSFAKKP